MKTNVHVLRHTNNSGEYENSKQVTDYSKQIPK